MFSYLDQFISSDYLPSSCKTQVEIICQPVQAFKKLQIQENNNIKVLEQIKVFKQGKQENFIKYTQVNKRQHYLFIENTKQFRAGKSDLVIFLRELQIPKARVSSITQLLWLKNFKNSFSLGITSTSARKEEEISSHSTSRTQNNLVKNEQDFSQNKDDLLISTVLNQTKYFNSNATLQKRVLLEIEVRQTENNNKPIEWKPAAWFSKGNITNSIRASWSKTLKTLINKGLVYKQIVADRQFSSNSGNTLSLVSLTSEGRQYLEQLKNSN